MKALARRVAFRALDWALSWDGFQRILCAGVVLALLLTLAAIGGCQI